MRKYLTTTEIAQLSGLSRGTVDRVLHNRGKVSEEARNKVEAILQHHNGYKYNIHKSAISFKKTFRLGVSLPDYTSEFWGQILSGIRYALHDYSDIDIDLRLIKSDPFNGHSQVEGVMEAAKDGLDAVIIAPVFGMDSLEICNILNEKNIPYSFVNTTIEGTKPVAAFTINHYDSGKMAAQLSDWITFETYSICLCYADRSTKSLNQETIERLAGFNDFFKNKPEKKVYKFRMDLEHVDQIKAGLTALLTEHPDIRGIFVANAWGSAIADALKDTPFKDYPLASYDLTNENRRCLENRFITALICQRPQIQGYKATESLLEYFLYKNTRPSIIEYLPIDVIFADNLPYYKELE